MKNLSLEKLVRKFALTGLLSVAALGQVKAAENPKDVKEEKGVKTEIILPPAPQGIFLDEQGSFDEKAAKEAFSKLNYQEKAPQVLEIYKDVKKNGFTQKSKDKLIALFPGNEQAARAINGIDAEVMKDVLSKSSFGVFDQLLFVAAILIGGLGILNGGAIQAQSYEGEIDLFSKESLRSIVSPLAIGVALATAGLFVHGHNIEDTISSEKEMSKVMILFQKNLHAEYVKKVERKLSNEAPDLAKRILLKNVAENSR